jgi:hypothetical protein
MTTQQQQRERVVLSRFRGRHGIRTPPGRLLRTQLVDQPAGRDRDQPGEWVVRLTIGRPLGGGRQQCLLHGVLGRLEMAVPPHQRREDPRRRLAQQVLELDVHIS